MTPLVRCASEANPAPAPMNASSSGTTAHTSARARRETPAQNTCGPAAVLTMPTRRFELGPIVQPASSCCRTVLAVGTYAVGARRAG